MLKFTVADLYEKKYTGKMITREEYEKKQKPSAAGFLAGLLKKKQYCA